MEHLVTEGEIWVGRIRPVARQGFDLVEIGVRLGLAKVVDPEPMAETVVDICIGHSKGGIIVAEHDDDVRKLRQAEVLQHRNHAFVVGGVVAVVVGLEAPTHPTSKVNVPVQIPSARFDDDCWAPRRFVWLPQRSGLAAYLEELIFGQGRGEVGMTSTMGRAFPTRL